MALNHKEVFPWGRNLIEYIKIFSLTIDDIPKKILDCAGGPSSFNYEMFKLGGKVISSDPIYALSTTEIEKKINQTHKLLLKELSETKENSPDGVKFHSELINIRLSAMKSFLDDYEKGKEEKRYVYAELPDLMFDSRQFDIALCAHFLFTYSEQLSLEFHIKSIREMTRVAQEVRIFPVFSLNGKKSNYLEPIIEVFSKENYIIQLLTVDYEMQKGSNQVLIVKNKA